MKERYSEQDIDAVIPDKGIDAQTKIKDKSLLAKNVYIADDDDHYTGEEVETALEEIGANVDEIEDDIDDLEDGTTLDPRYVNVTGDTSTGEQKFEGGVKVGAGTNYTEIQSDGTVIRHGTARTLNAIWIDSSGLKAPPTKAAEFVDHGLFGAWQFSDAADDTIVANMRIPYRMDRDVAPTFTIGWSTTPTSGNCEWQVEYLWRKVDEDTTAAADDTLLASTDAGGTQAASTTAEGMVMTTFTLAAPHTDDVCLHLRIRRRADLDADTINGADVELHGVCMTFTSNKLGG